MDGWMASHDEATLDPLDGTSLHILFLQPEPVISEEEYYWDLEPPWQAPMDLDPNPLQGYAVPDYLTHYAEDDFVQEDPRVLRDKVYAFSSIFDAVCDANHDPCSYIGNEEFPRLDILYPSNRDCSIMVTDLVPLTDLWDFEVVVNIQVGAEVWTVNRTLADGGLWDVPFIIDSEPITEVAAVKDLSFWDSLLMKD
ncbi:hypothetical protein RHMOL_Rhmol10G0178400 [Rhododendron molle]|uniref:Uncharacterized protein n=1 Tax=Rhododendron molle TaxID=49168 RepID=A0ACC0M4J4_RHOML|nr:hypothetical protein RHMOL_Rhmol10G0178400 [Rhododendron molle]